MMLDLLYLIFGALPASFHGIRLHPVWGETKTEVLVVLSDGFEYGTDFPNLKTFSRIMEKIYLMIRHGKWNGKAIWRRRVMRGGSWDLHQGIEWTYPENIASSSAEKHCSKEREK